MAATKAKAEGLKNRFIRQKATNTECIKYLDSGIWALRWPREPSKIEKSTPLPVKQNPERPMTPIVSEAMPKVLQREELPACVPVPLIVPMEPAKQPLQAPKRKKQKNLLANGRNSKGVAKFENWFGRVYPADFAYPAWRFLTKSATDVANICRAKRDHAAALGKKDSSGVPVFDFTVSEAEKTFKITRPTFSKAIELLVNVGFIERARCGGMPDGVGVKALYRMSEKWKTWEPPPRDNSNILKARAARKQIAR